MARVQSRVVCEVGRTDLRRVTGVLRGSGIVFLNKRWVYGLGDLQWESAGETLSGTLDGVLARVGGQGFLALHAQVKGAVTAGPAHCFLRCDGAVYPHLAGTDAGLGVAEDVALLGKWVSIGSRVYAGSFDLDTYCQNVHHANYHCQDAGGDDDSPESQANVFLGHSLGVQVAQCRNSQDHHDPTERVEARFLSEHRPVVVEIALEHWELRDNHEDCHR